MIRPQPVKDAIRAERYRCSGLLSLTIDAIKAAVPAAIHEHMPLILAPLERLHRDFRIGRRLPAPKPRKRARTVCSYCEGDGHNKSTCVQRFADIASGKVKVAA